MSISNLVNRVIAVLKISRSIAALISYAKSIVSAMTDNKYFPDPSPALAVITNNITELETAESIAHTKVIGSVQARDVKKQVLINSLRSSLAYIQSVADKDPTNAQAIILSAGVGIKQTVARTKTTFDAKQGTSGCINLTAKSAGQHSAYEWNMSIDGNKWDYLPTTLTAKTIVSGLIRGTSYYFRYRVVKTSGLGDWSQSLNMIAT